MLTVLKINKDGNRIKNYTCTDGINTMVLTKEQLAMQIEDKQVTNATRQITNGNIVIRVKSVPKAKKGDAIKMRCNIKAAMYDLMQNNCRCDYEVVAKDPKLSKKFANALSLDIYVQTYKAYLKCGQAVCYMAPGGQRAARPVFQCSKEGIFLSGVKIEEA